MAYQSSTRLVNEALAGIQAMVVDDSRQMRMMVRTLLRGFGITRCIEAADGAEAFEYMRAAPVDLLLVDFNMQPLDGIEFTRLIRTARDSPNPNCPIIMITAHSEPSKVRAARDCGVNSFLVKPFSAKLIMSHLNAAFMDERPFIYSNAYVGPDRRRRAASADASTPTRRCTDVSVVNL